MDENGKRIRYDKFGNQITTKIGTFSVENRKAQIKAKKEREKAMSMNSDTGGAESPLKSDDDRSKKQQRHRISFADQVSGNEKSLSDVHYIESYKKYN